MPRGKTVSFLGDVVSPARRSKLLRACDQDDRIPPPLIDLVGRLSLTNNNMSSLEYATVAPGSAAAQRNARGFHPVRFVSADSRCPEVKQALPDLGWDVDTDGATTLPVGELFRIVSIAIDLNGADAGKLFVFGDFPQMEEISRIWVLVASKLVLTGELMAWPSFKAAYV